LKWLLKRLKMIKKRIAFISDHASPIALPGSVDNGGQNVYVAELSKELARMGFFVDVFTRKNAPDLNEVVPFAPGVRIINIKAGPENFVEKERLLPYMEDFTSNMLLFIKERGLEYIVVHANFFMSALVASNIKAELGIPYVVTFHALGLVRLAHQKEMDKFPVERFDIERMIMEDADRIIAECPQDREDLIEYYNAPAQKISVIACGFSSDEFSEVDMQTARKELGLSPTETILLQLGRMVPRKGVDNVIRSLKKITRTVQNARLLIVGGECEIPDEMFTPEIGRLKAIARDEGVLDKITFTGRRSREVLKYYYSAADIFITTPWYEPFGITPLESMACGTPVIGSNVGGIKYSVADGKTGFLVPPHDSSALADKVIELVSNPVLLSQMKADAVKHVNKNFTWKQVAQAVCALYHEVHSQHLNYKPTQVIALDSLPSNNLEYNVNENNLVSLVPPKIAK